MKMLTSKGITLSITDWAIKSGIGRRVIAYRLTSGWSVDNAVSFSATNGNNQFLRY